MNSDEIQDQNIQLEYSSSYSDEEYKEDEEDEENEFSDDEIYYDEENEEVLQQIYDIEYMVNNYKSIENKSDCNICLEDDNAEYLIQTSCSHVFHKKCLDEWLNKKENCPICRLEFIICKSSETLEDLIDSITLNPNYQDIVSMIIGKKNIIYYCDECDKTISSDNEKNDEKIIRYHKKNFNYDLCLECYIKKNLSDEEKEQFIAYYQNKKYNFKNKFPNSLNKLILKNIDGIFDNHLIKTKEFTCDNIVFNNCIINSDSLEINQSEFNKSIIIFNKSINIFGVKIDIQTINSIFENITEYNNIKNIQIILKILDPIVSFRLSIRSIKIFSNPNNFSNLTKLILESDKITFIPCVLDLSNIQLNHIHLYNWTFEYIQNLPSTLIVLYLKRAVKNHIDFLDLSNCKLLEDIYIEKMDISTIKFFSNIIISDHNNHLEKKISILKSKLKKIIDLPIETSNLNLENNNLNENSFEFDLEKINLKNINLSYNKLTNIDILPKKILNLTIKNNKLVLIDLTKFKFLKNLDCSNNFITSFKSNKFIDTLDISNNYLTNFLLDNRLSNLNLSRNLLTEFIIQSKNVINNINLSHNRLINLDLKKISIFVLNCSWNKIINLSNLGNTVHLNISHNPILNLLLSYGKFQYINVNYTNIIKIEFDHYDNISLQKFKFNKSKIQNKIILIKNNNSSDPKLYFILNENTDLILFNN